MKAFIRFECECGVKEEVRLLPEDAENGWYDLDIEYSINKMDNFSYEQSNPESFVVHCKCGKELELG